MPLRLGPPDARLGRNGVARLLNSTRGMRLRTQGLETGLFTKLKARLVLRGFEEENVTAESPTLTKEGFFFVRFLD